MRLGKYLSGLTKSELEELKEELNLTDDEEMVFSELAKGRSIITISDKCMVCCSTVSNRIKDIQNKVNKIRKGA